MAHEYTTWAYKQKLPSTTKFVLVVIADRANHEGVCWPSRKDIAERTGLSERSVTRAIDELKSDGLIQVKEQRRKDGYKTNNLYQLISGDRESPKEQPIETEQDISCDTESGDNLSGDTQSNSQGTQCLDNNYPTDSNKPSLEPSGGNIKKTFDDFWKVYPKKTGIGAARTEWGNQIFLKSADPSQMVNAARNYYSKRLGEDDQFTKSPANFLSEQVYMDEDLQAEPSQPMDRTGLVDWQLQVLEKVGEAQFKGWFQSAQLREKTLFVENKFTADFIREKFSTPCRGVFGSIEVHENKNLKSITGGK